MNFTQFSSKSSLTDVSQIQKVILLAFFSLKRSDVHEWSIADLSKFVQEQNLGSPNATRLREQVIASRAFIKSSNGKFKLKLKTIQDCEGKFPELINKSEEIISDDTILPEGLYEKTRGYLINVSKQINASYQHNLFDGCAMLMRRLMEMLIILTYKHLGRENEIQTANGGNQPLSYLINYSLTHQVLGLSRDSNNVLDEFRQLGNHSAHGLEYNCKKGDLDKIKISYRVCIEELMYKCGVKR
jgi:hypothetical protein